MSCSRHLHAPADAADADATRSCRAPDRVEPTGSTPRPRRFLPRAGRTMTTFDALSRRACAEAPHAPPGPPSSLPRQRQRFRRPRTSSIDECPLGPRACAQEASNANPPPNPGLCRPGPASDALSPRAPEGGGARPCRFRTLFAPGRAWPRAARRLLQSKGSASTTDGPSKPRFRIGPRGFRRAPHFAAGPARRIGRPSERPSFHRSGAEDSRVRGRFFE